jgi:hypothetical protein
VGLHLRYELSIAGAAFDVWAPPELDLSLFDARAVRFARSDRSPPLRIEVRAAATDAQAVSIARPRHGRDGDSVWIEGNGARVSFTGGLASSVLDPAHLDAAFDNLLRFSVSRHLLQTNGALMHAAGLIGELGGVAFPGVSGAGKSTIAMRHPETQRVSEDLLAVTCEGGRWFVHGVPFFAANKIDVGPRRAPLAGLAFLKKASAVKGRPMSATEARARIARSLVSFAPEGLEEIVLDRIVRLSREVPAIELELDRVSPVWPELTTHFSSR